MFQDPKTWCQHNIDKLGSYFFHHNDLRRNVSIYKIIIGSLILLIFNDIYTYSKII